MVVHINVKFAIKDLLPILFTNHISKMFIIHFTTHPCTKCNTIFDKYVKLQQHIEQIKFCHRVFRYPFTLRKHIQFKHSDCDPNDLPAPRDRLLAPQFNHNNI